jgi:hypothetical protein
MWNHNQERKYIWYTNFKYKNLMEGVKLSDFKPGRPWVKLEILFIYLFWINKDGIYIYINQQELEILILQLS